MADTASLDVLLIGAGIASATSGTFIEALVPSVSIAMVESSHDFGRESFQSWNNAGTGHAATCELNDTPQRA